MKKILTFFLALGLFGCETTINPELKAAHEIVVIDAWVNQKMSAQEIKITRSQTYFQNQEPTHISGAEVLIEDLNSGEQYIFEEQEKSYVWQPSGKPLGEIGHTFRLTVKVAGETFEAYSTMGRAPEIDYIEFHFNEADVFIEEDYFTAEYMAKDFPGTGDAYWIRAWKNGEYLGKPAELNMIFDGGFSQGQPIDGEAFVIPSRTDMISPMDAVEDETTIFKPPYLEGDSVHVEILGIDAEAFEFLYGLYFSIDRPGGFAELFSTPLANVTTNIVPQNIETDVAGFFNVASVSSRGQKLTKELADKAKIEELGNE